MKKDQPKRYKNLHLTQLRAFCECVRHKSFAAAARALGVSQATVWQQVRALERYCGASLVHRRGRGLEPSEDGLVILDLASGIVASTDSLRERFVQLRAEEPRMLVVVGSPGVLGGELARAVVEFRRRYPQITLRLITNSGIDRTWELLFTGEADLGVMPHDLLGSPAQRRLGVVEPLCSRPVMLAIPAGHPLARKRRLTLNDLARHPLILNEGDNEWRKQVDSVFRSAGLLDRLQIILEVSLTQAMRRFVSLGLGIALFPLPQDDIQYPNMLLRSVDDLFPGQEIVLLWRRGIKPRLQAQLFAECLHHHLQTVEQN